MLVAPVRATAPGVIQMQAATFHVILMSLEQTSQALTHAQDLCMSAAAAFAREQVSVRAAIHEMRVALRAAGYRG